MKELLWLIPTLPFAGGLLLIVTGRKIPKALVPIIGAGSVGIAALITILVGIDFTSGSDKSFEQAIWTWMNVDGLAPRISFHLDALSLVFLFVITFVGFLIHVYSAEFMQDDEGYARF